MDHLKHEKYTQTEIKTFQKPNTIISNSNENYIKKLKNKHKRDIISIFWENKYRGYDGPTGNNESGVDGSD